LNAPRESLQTAHARADGLTVRFAARVLTALVVTVTLVAGSALSASAATGPDVSSWNHPNGASINWHSVRAAGHSFAFVKATQGPTVAGGSFYTNPYYTGDAAGAAAAGLYVGSYDFAVPALPISTAALQARAFVSVVGSLHGSMQLPPVLDLEQTGGLSVGNLQAWVQSWLTEAQHLTGRMPMIYTSPSFWKTSMGNTSSMSGYRLWLASWTSASTPGALPGGWSTWTMWQYTDNAGVPGISGGVDLSRYCCSVSNLAALARGAGDEAAGNPFGHLDGAGRSPGTINITGWAIDPDTTNALTVHVYVDGTWTTKGTTGVSRPDVAAAYPGWGGNRGFSIDVPVSPGTHTVCAYGINQGPGNSNSKLGCLTVSGRPIGALQSLTQVPGGVQVQGWVQDPDSADPATAHIYVDGKWRAAVTGNPTSFSIAIGAMGDGAHTFCLYGIDSQGLDGNPKLGCMTTTVTGAPFGHFEAATAVAGGIEVGGWAIDPNTSSPIDVHLYVDGVYNTSIVAGVDRPDVGAAYTQSGSDHGFDDTISLPAGSHTVCAYAINTGLGASNTSLGCRTVG
jgi:GH25 family lysozyme M1 (1,4-beta-N-acetylmuramidase)